LSIHHQKRKSKAETIDYFAKYLTIHEQREAELINITNSLNLAQEIAKIGSWDYDVENNTIYCSDPLYSILGIEKDGDIQPLYENLLAMILPEDREYFDYLFQQTIKFGTEMDIEYKNSKTGWFHNYRARKSSWEKRSQWPSQPNHWRFT
jgi:PAS domain-containing protein